MALQHNWWRSPALILCISINKNNSSGWFFKVPSAMAGSGCHVSCSVKVETDRLGHDREHGAKNFNIQNWWGRASLMPGINYANGCNDHLYTAPGGRQPLPCILRSLPFLVKFWPFEVVVIFRTNICFFGQKIRKWVIFWQRYFGRMSGVLILMPHYFRRNQTNLQ